MPPSTLVLIPACNESESIGPVLAGVRRELPDADLLVVDDGSSDDTAHVVRAHGGRVLHHPFNLGYGAALQTGYHYARQHGYELLVQLDADGQHDPGSLPALLAPLQPDASGTPAADLVVGSRYRSGTPPPTSRLRRFGSLVFSWLVTRWTGYHITDPTSGFQAMNARALDHLTLDHFPEDYPDADVLITLARAGLRLVEVPVRMHPRLKGVSMHRGGRAAYYAYKMLLNLALLPWRRTSPFRAGRALAASRGRGDRRGSAA